MAITTGSLTKSVAMRVVFHVTAPTLRLDGFVATVGVTALTFDFFMTALKGEPTHGVVIESQMRSLEPFLVMTLTTGSAPKLASMIIFVTT